MISADLSVALAALEKGSVIAYPTESVYGLGVDPFNEQAMQKLIALKERSANKGIILISDSIERILPLIEKPVQENWQQVLQSWPGPYTWCFTPSQQVSKLVCGEHPTVAIRVSAHPLVQMLVKSYGKVITSTSANLSYEPPCQTADEVAQVFGDQIEAVVAGQCLGLPPTQIRNANTLEILRG